jgi:DNA processing protein
VALPGAAAYSPGVDEHDALLHLALIPGLGPLSAHKLLRLAGSAVAVRRLGMDRLIAVDGVGGDRARRICDPRAEERVAQERADCHGAAVRICLLGDPDYPKAFAELNDPPLALWLRGEWQPRDRLAVAMVGPRKPSAYAHRQAHRLSLALARIGTCLVGGLARGVDTVAHEAALAGGSRTIAVLGSGFGQLYPEENRPLAERIASGMSGGINGGNGVVLSEFPFATPPSATTFPRRNRLIAALALATVVVEAPARSGALVIARLSAELGREVLVVPGPMDAPECVGSNRLIRDGATLLTAFEDILEEVEPLLTLAGSGAGREVRSAHGSNLSGREKQVYLMIGDQARSIEDLVRTCTVPSSAVSATLLSLELKRLVRKLANGYVRAT